MFAKLASGLKNYLSNLYYAVRIKKQLENAFPKNSKKKLDRSYVICDPVFNVENGFGLAVFASSIGLAKKLNATPIFLYEKDFNKKELNKLYCKILGPFETVSVEEMLRTSKVKKTVSFKNLSIKKIYNYNYKGIKVGRCIYDSCIWKKKYTVTNYNNLKQIAFLGIKYFEAIKKICENYKIIAGFFTHTTGIQSGIPLRFLLSKKIPVFCSYGNMKNFQRINYINKKLSFVTVPGSVSLNEIKHCLKDRLCIEEAKKYFEKITK